MKIINHLLTGRDNETHDIGRWSWAISMLAIICAVGFNVFHGALVDIMMLSQSLGAVVLAHGGALFAKAKTEPESESKP